MPIQGPITFFLFDYNAMDTSYGSQAFESIYECLKKSTGYHSFYDGDLVNSEALRQLIETVKTNKPANEKSVIVTKEYTSIGPYIVAMWTELTERAVMLDDHLIKLNVPGYQGFLQMTADVIHDKFIEACSRSLGLSQSIFLRAGKVMKGTAKYGVGVKPEDAELLQAASSGNLKQVFKAILEGADVECIDYLDRVSTPLFHAAVGGHADIVRLLLKYGASPDTNNGSTTALMIASRFGHFDIVKALIEGGVNVDYADSDGITALQEAKEHIEIVQLLKKASLAKKWWQFWK